VFLICLFIISINVHVQSHICVYIHICVGKWDDTAWDFGLYYPSTAQVTTLNNAIKARAIVLEGVRKGENSVRCRYEYIYICIHMYTYTYVYIYMFIDMYVYICIQLML
jgi:hypothetical protein